MALMHAKNVKEGVLTINHWNLVLQIVGVIICGGGVVVFMGFASIVPLWKPQTIVEVIKGCMGYLLLISFASTLLLAGLRLVCGPDGSKIDANQKTICVWRRNIWLRRKQSSFPFDQVKHIKIKEERKHGVFSPNRIFRVVAGDEPNEAELHYFLSMSEAQTLAKRVAEFSGLQFLE